MRSDPGAPGLKVRRNPSGSKRLYWCAPAPYARAGYRPTSVRLPYSLEEPAHRPLIAALCKKLQARCWPGQHAAVGSRGASTERS